MATVHVIGAGLAGLACAVDLRRRGVEVAVHEAAPMAGGRCRSYHDTVLDRTIDNGNHLLLSANTAVLDYLATIGASDRLTGPDCAKFPFVDRETGARWTLSPNQGVVPWWVLSRRRRVPGLGLRDLIAGWRVVAATADRTMGEILGNGPVVRRFWEPMTLAVMNAPMAEAAAAPMGRVIRETFLRGGQACRPLVAREGLADALVDPALVWLERNSVTLKFGRRLRALEHAAGTAPVLRFGDGEIRTAPGDAVVLALPPPVVRDLLPDLGVPDAHASILNLHYRLPAPARLPEPDVPFVGLIGAVAQWVFLRGDVASVTISAADDWIDAEPEDLAKRVWADVAFALGIPGDTMPPWRVIKEKRATFRQSPAAQRLRPGVNDAGSPIVLAGDWTDTGLPATIEGAVRSGRRAADAAHALVGRS